MNSTEHTPTNSRSSSGVLGAVVAVALGCLLLAGIAVIQPFGPTNTTFERPEILVAGLALSAVLGWRLGPGVAHRGWLRAVGGGLAFGFLWPPVAMFVAMIGGIADATLRGAANPLDVGPAFVWALYGLGIAWVYGSVVAIPAGIIWAVITLAVARAGGVRVASRGRGSTARLAIGLVAIALATGTVQAANYAPRDARCLDLPGGAPTDAAFSPAGDLLAVTVQTDPNEIGTVLLLRWPSGEVITSWSAWVEDAVAVDPDGRVYWSAWVLGPFSMDGDDISNGIYSATIGSKPTWFATGDERTLNDLTWTANALRGTTPNSHRLASISLTGAHRMRTTLGREEIGAFWASADGATTVTGPSYFGSALEIRTRDGGSHSVPSGEARSVGLSGDGRTLVVASWFNGTRLIDVGTGQSRLVLNGSQTFVAVSQNGDVAWANEEQFGHARLCTSTFERLG